MGKRCFVPMCTSGSRTNKRKVSIFVPPQDKLLLWSKVIGRKDRELTRRDGVCELHFKPEQILRELKSRTHSEPLKQKRLKRGTIPCFATTAETRMQNIQIPLGRPKLAGDAVPSIFPVGYSTSEKMKTRVYNTSKSRIPKIVADDDDKSMDDELEEKGTFGSTENEREVADKQEENDISTSVLYRIPENVTSKIFSDSSALVLPSDSWTVHTLLNCVVYFQLMATCGGNVIMSKKFIVYRDHLKCFLLERECEMQYLLETLDNKEIESIVDLQNIFNKFAIANT